MNFSRLVMKMLICVCYALLGRGGKEVCSDFTSISESGDNQSYRWDMFCIRIRSDKEGNEICRHPVVDNDSVATRKEG